MDQSLEKRVSARKVLITSFLVDILDVFLNLVVTLLSGSVIMLSRVLEGFSDLAASGILLFGFARSQKRADKDHPFGYGREIYFWALISALVTFGLTATLSIYFGIDRFLNPEPIRNLELTVLVVTITLFTNGYAFLLSVKRLIQKRKLLHIIKIFYRSSLIETKTTFILDFMGTTASVLGLIALVIYTLSGDLRFDGFGAILIGIGVSISAVFLIIGIRDLLIGKSASQETEEKIKNAAQNIDEVKEVLGVKTLHVGSEKLLVDLDVHMDAKLTTRELERLMDRIKEEIRREVPSVKYLQVELETPRR